MSNRSVSHKGRFAGDRSRRKKAIVDHKDEEHAEEVDIIRRDYYGRSGDRHVHPIYAGVYLHRSEPSSIKSRGHISSLSTSTQSKPLNNNDLEQRTDKCMTPVLTYAQTNAGHKRSSAPFGDGIARTAEWLLNQDRQNFRNHVAAPGPDTRTTTPVEDTDVEKAWTEGRVKEGSLYSQKSFADYPDIPEFQPFHGNHKAAPCYEISFEPAPTGTIGESAEIPGSPENPPSDKRTWQLTLPSRARHYAITSLADHTDLSPNGLPHTSNVAFSQTNQESTALGSKPSDGNSSSGARKRKIGQGSSSDEPEEDSDGGDEGDDGDRRNNRHQRGKSHKGKEAALPSLACPYFKYDPTKYVGKDWRNCCGPGWPSVHRMKEHLYKHHRQPKFVCERCGLFFQDEENLKDHRRQIAPCVLQELKPMDGFDSKQEIKLKSRKRVVTELPEVEKWKQTYRILFPHVPGAQIPSPFYEYVESGSKILTDYEEYALREIQGGLRPTLERELETNLNITGSASKQRAVELFEKMQLMLLQKFRNAYEQRITTPTTSTSASVVILQERSETRPPPEFPTFLSTDQPSFSGDNDSTSFTGALGAAQDFDFDFDLYTDADGRPLLEVMVEPFSNNVASKPSDSAYGSMSIKESSEYSRDSV